MRMPVSVKKSKQLNASTLEASLECACLSFRQAARMVTQLFDDALMPVGLLSAQVPILIVLALYNPLTITRLASMLLMDRTTLTKNLKVLKARGFIREASDKDKRKTLLFITPKGHIILVETHPLWLKAQKRIVDGYGKDKWQVIRKDLAKAVQLVSGR
jgi:DNA-binding MarR family transcriptional regulator